MRKTLKVAVLLLCLLVTQIKTFGQCEFTSSCGYKVVLNMYEPTINITERWENGMNIEISFNYVIYIDNVNNIICPYDYYKGKLYDLGISFKKENTTIIGTKHLCRDIKYNYIGSHTTQKHTLNNINKESLSYEELGFKPYITVNGPGLNIQLECLITDSLILDIDTSTFNRGKCEDQIKPLPIILKTFESNCNEVKWVTSSEINNKEFNLYGSNDMNVWFILNTTEGSGNRNTETTYKYIDKIGFKYYKLQQVDYDDKYEIFDPITDKCSKVKITGNYIISEYQIKSYIINDINGRRIYQSDVMSNLININVPNGIYVYTIETINGDIVNIKVVR